MYKFGSYFAKQLNLQDYFPHKQSVPNIVSTDIRISIFLNKNGGGVGGGCGSQNGSFKASQNSLMDL